MSSRSDGRIMPFDGHVYFSNQNWVELNCEVAHQPTSAMFTFDLKAYESFHDPIWRLGPTTDIDSNFLLESLSESFFGLTIFNLLILWFSLI
jgi:hypothetical protein